MSTRRLHFLQQTANVWIIAVNETAGPSLNSDMDLVQNDGA